VKTTLQDGQTFLETCNCSILMPAGWLPRLIWRQQQTCQGLLFFFGLALDVSFLNCLLKCVLHVLGMIRSLCWLFNLDNICQALGDLCQALGEVDLDHFQQDNDSKEVPSAAV